MSRAGRLLDLLQLLRRHRGAVAGAAIAAELGVSLRTLYRDVATLQAQGIHIDGAPGLGYVLRPGAVLPPLMFSADEIEALALGLRWVAARGDVRLAAAGRDALAKIASVVPGALRHELDTPALLVGPGDPAAAGSTGATGDGDDAAIATIRQAIREERKLAIAYRDAAQGTSERTIWPFALGYFDRARVVVAWCELRDAIRHFRADRIVVAAPCADRFPRRRQALLKEWREREGMVERRPGRTAGGN